MNEKIIIKILIPMFTTAISLSIVAAVYVFNQYYERSTNTEKGPYKRAILAVLIAILSFYFGIIITGGFGLNIIPLVVVINMVDLSIGLFTLGISLLVLTVIYLSAEILIYS